MDYTTSRAFADIALIYGIVIVVSLLVAVVIRLIVWTLSRQAERAPKSVVAKPLAKPVADPGIPPEHVVVIAAAVAAMTGAHRVVRIAPTPGGQAWTAIARSAHQTSHLPRKS